MGILSRIKSWFNTVESASIITPINEASPEQATIETGEQNSKADKLIEAIKVAYAAPSSVESSSIKSETALSHDSPSTPPKPQQKKRRSRKSKKSVSRSKKKEKEAILKS